MGTVLRYLLGPRLYRMYRQDDEAGKVYVMNPTESLGDMVVKWVRFCWSFSYWGSPIIIPLLYRKGMFTMEGMVLLASYGGTISVLLTIAVVMRAIGRATNPDYTRFMGVLTAAQKDYNPPNKYKLSRYDFDFSSWPEDYQVKYRSKTSSLSHRGLFSTVKALSTVDNQQTLCAKCKTVVMVVASYVAVRTFGIRMIYPGQTALINTLVSEPLQAGRAKLVEEHNGVRSKIRTEDGNAIDTMFIDRRNSRRHQNGNTLVICCEGNSAFYEIGCTVTPLGAGYSVLGWNHPGFGGSTGVPYPSNERCAVEGVLHYAVNKLGFQPHEIVMFAWSIGGYSAAYAGTLYPDIKHMVLDATFDDLLPLALAKMPKFMDSLITMAIKMYVDLDISTLLCKYPGPVLMIRRSRDEMITTGDDPLVISNNRGNFLLLQLLQCRYPSIVDDNTIPLMKEFLTKPTSQRSHFLQRYDVDMNYCDDVLKSFAVMEDEKSPGGFPLNVTLQSPEEKKQLALYLVFRYMNDFDSSHCVPLPPSFFKVPWSL